MLENCSELTQQRERHAPRMPAVGSQQRHRQQHRPQRLARRQAVVAKDFEHPRQQRRAAAEQQQPAQVERLGGVAAVVGHVAPGQPQRQHADRHAAMTSGR
jgi:hypothetical protein